MNCLFHRSPVLAENPDLVRTRGESKDAIGAIRSGTRSRVAQSVELATENPHTFPLKIPEK